MNPRLLRVGATLTLLVSILALFSGTSLGRVPRARSAASCSPLDVQNAVDAVDIGGTVTLPACVYPVWNGTVFITKPIILEGRGTQLTTLRRQAGGALIMFRVTGVTGFEIRNLTLDGTYDTHPNVYQDLGLWLSDAVDFRIHNVAFQNLSRGIEIHGDPTLTRGVIYQNTFTDMFYLDPIRGALGYGVVVYGNGTWPPLRLGTLQNVFIEDNTFTRNRHAVASNNGSRYVFRHNAIVDNREDAAAIDAHGRGAWPRGSRQYEIYANTVDNAVPRYAGVGIRGGDGVIFNNRFSFNVTNDILLTNEGGCVGTYPLPDQIQKLNIWNNTLPDATGARIIVQAGCEAFLQLNRNYFTTPLLGYVPFTYPHPSRF